jgi:hypothetical protein
MITNIQADICPNPIFIIGSPRSGTSILAWALAQHSQLWTSVESDVLFDLYGGGHVDRAYQTARARPDDSDWLNIHGVGRAEFLSYLGLGLNALIASRSEGRRWIDQTPRNTLMVDVLVDMFPGAFFLHILRDGRRVVNSMIHFSDLLGAEGSDRFKSTGRLPKWATDFRTACQTWCQFVEAALTFEASHPDCCLTVVNEQLASHTQECFSEIFRFVGVAYEDTPIRYFRSNRINSSFRPASTKPGWVQNLTNPWEEWTEERKQVYLEEAGPTLAKHDLAHRYALAPSGSAPATQPSHA